MSQLGKYTSLNAPLETLTGNIGGAVYTTNNNINIVGTAGLVVTGTPGTSTLSISGATLAGIFVTDVGGPALTAANTISFINGSNISTDGSVANTVMVNLIDSPHVIGTVSADLGFVTSTGNLSLPATNVAGTQGVIEINGSSFIHALGTQNTFVGVDDGVFVTTGALNTGIGFNALNAVDAGNGNTAVGNSALLTSNGASDGNTAVGIGALKFATTATYNNAFGSAALQNLLTGTNNIALGSSAGIALVGAESNNIYLENSGVAAESNTIRIGEFASHTGAFMAGVANVAVANLELMTMDITSGEMGTTTYTPAAQFAWYVIAADQGALINTGYICNKVGLLTLTLPVAATAGDVIRITGINTAVGWRIAQNAAQIIYFGTANTTPGITGYIESTQVADTIEILCVVDNSDFQVISWIGNLTVI